MGCCASREVSRSHSPRNESLSDTSRASTPGTPTETAIQVNESIAGDANNSSEHNTFRRPNVSLRRPKGWRSTSRTWTRQQLVRERQIFWETQVTGRKEVWAALRLAVEMADGTAGEQQQDLKGAKAVIDAAGCTCPTGRLSEGVWDEQGRLYKLPRWVVSDPVNVIEGHAGDEDDDDDDDDIALDEDVEDEEDEEAKDGVQEFYRERGDIDKGKDKMPTGPNAITITTRLSDRGTDLTITIDKEQPVKALVRRVQADAGIATNVKLKIAYMGRILKDNESLISQGWKAGHVVNALVFN